jgi:replicative DNA helicase
VLAAEARVAVSHLRNGHLNESDRDKLDRHYEALASSPILIDAAWPVESTTDRLLDSASAWMSEGGPIPSPRRNRRS